MTVTQQTPPIRPLKPASGQMFLNRAYRTFSPIVKSKKTVSYVTLTLSLFSLSFFGLFAIRPTLITAVSLMKNVADLRKLNQDYENKISTVIRAQSEYEKIRSKIPLIHTALPERSEFPVVIRALEDFAERSGMTINQLQVDAAPISKRQKTVGVQKFGFNIVAVGDYPATVAYIQHLTEWRRIITISAIELNQEGSTESAQVRLSLKGTTYYEP